jgi:hypothetical protein
MSITLYTNAEENNNKKWESPPSSTDYFAQPDEYQTTRPRFDPDAGRPKTDESTVTSGQAANEEYWNNRLKAEQDALAYDDNVYQAAVKTLNEYESDLMRDVVGGPQGLAAQVEGAYGAAASRGRQGAQNIKEQGQRSAAGIEASYGEAAARAEGLASGQGLGETTALSGFIPVSGEAAYTPTVGRAYGLAAADFTGATANIESDAMRSSSAARGQGRMTLDQWVQTNMSDIRFRLNMANSTAAAAAESAQTKAAKSIAAERTADKFAGTQAADVLAFMDRLWEADENEISKNVRKIYGDKSAFLSAVEARLKINSERSFQQWFNQYTGGEQALGMSPLFGGGIGSIYGNS